MDLRRGAAGLGLAFGWALLIAADATALSFQCITFNSPVDCATGEAQLGVDFSDAGGGLVLFTVLNTGAEIAVVTDIYFDDGDDPLLGDLFGLIDADEDALGSFGHPDVDFSEGASPHNLPGHQFVGFKSSAGLAADADPPPASMGVAPGEWLGIVYDLADGRSFGDVFDELASGDLRIGLHVQGFEGGGSDSFVNNIPEPGSLSLLGLGLGALGIRGRRR